MTEGPPRPPRELTVRLVEPEAKKPTPDIFKRVAELLGLAALLAGLILSLGWSYAYAWFQAWKMPLAEIELKTDVQVSPDFARDIAPGRPCYRVVYTAPDAIWLARTRDNNRDPLVAMVPRDQIALLRLYPRQGNCPAGVS